VSLERCLPGRGLNQDYPTNLSTPTQISHVKVFEDIHGQLSGKTDVKKWNFIDFILER
jgi:hypothetical protein